LIDRTLQLHEHSLRRNNIEVTFQPYNALPTVTGDANQLIQVFLNLISNAEHAIREVRETGRIQIRVGRTGSHVSISVQDDGVGILPEALPRLFDPFYTTKRPGGGTGLGLSICMSIIREHGGSINVEALPAGGSAFTVFLPIASDQQSPVAPATDPGFSISPLFRAANEALKGRSVLVLDDEESLRMLLEEGLSVRGLHVDCAATPAEALDFARKRSYDVLLCDVHLSASGWATDGHQIADQIVAATRGNKPTVIFMTGDLVDASGPAVAGTLRLQKPFRISDVLAMLREILSVSPVEKVSN
jgi:CheY-like chemotaxis protein